jgi:hypothetical protein
MAELDWRNQSTSGSQSQWGTTGTLGSQGLYRPVAPPRRSQAQGIQGTDERAYTRQVTGDELVENRINSMTNRADPYMQNAARRGVQTAARRGMGLSSIAAGAAERSALEAAMPIASADAATFGRTQAENMEALNRGLMQERDIQNQQTIEGSRLAQAGSDTAMRERIAMMGFDVDLQRQRENLAFAGEQQGLDRSQQQWMAQFGLGADLARGTQSIQLQDWFSSRQGQRDLINQMTAAEFGMGLGVQSQFYANFADIFFDDPEFFGSPQVAGAITNFGQTFRAPFMNFFNRYYGGGG